VAITGRLVALAALGILLAGVPALLGAYAGVLLAAVLVDLALAARIADVHLSRDELTAIRQGDVGVTTVRLRNTGRRTLHARSATRGCPRPEPGGARAVATRPVHRIPSAGHRAAPDAPRACAGRAG